MIQAPDLPLWAAIAVGVFVLLGASITLVGALGLLRFDDFYQRMHPPTLGATCGAACILIASTICLSTLRARPMTHELLIIALVTVTNPITLLLLARAALYRDRSAGSAIVPAEIAPEQADS
jgi:multicomponent K+:H+ antiporter subunit G